MGVRRRVDKTYTLPSRQILGKDVFVSMDVPGTSASLSVAQRVTEKRDGLMTLVKREG
jgi:hypothetical protein